MSVKRLFTNKLLLSGFALFALVLQPFANVAHAATSLVQPSGLNGWSFVDDNGNGGSGSFVTGPSGALGTGSAELSVTASNQGYMLSKFAYGGTKLSDITALSYQTYVAQGNNTIAPALQLNVDRDTTDADFAWQGRLVYEPYQNSTVTDGTWQTWDTLGAGEWWFSKPSAFDNVCGQAAPCTFDQIKTAFPNIGIHAVFSGVGFKAGSGWNVPFTGNVDNFVFNSDTYDFEPDYPVPSVTAQDFGTVDNTALGFQGITAGFGLIDFDTVSSITVTLSNANGDIVTNTATPEMIAKLNAENWTQFSSPFVVNGTFDDDYCDGSACWTTSAHTWTAADKPTTVTATVTGTNIGGQEFTKTATNTNFVETEPTFDSIVPEAPVTTDPGQGSTNTPVALTSSTSTTAPSVDDEFYDDFADAETLGATTDDTTSDDKTDEKKDDKSDDKTETKNQSGLEWYWWILIILAAAGAGYWLYNATRRNDKA